MCFFVNGMFCHVVLPALHILVTTGVVDLEFHCLCHDSWIGTFFHLLLAVQSRWVNFLRCTQQNGFFLCKQKPIQVKKRRGIISVSFWIWSSKSTFVQVETTVFRLRQSFAFGSGYYSWKLKCEVFLRVGGKWQELVLNTLCYQAFFGFVYTNFASWVQASIQNDWDGSLSLKIIEHQAISANFLLLW